MRFTAIAVGRGSISLPLREEREGGDRCCLTSTRNEEEKSVIDPTKTQSAEASALLAPKPAVDPIALATLRGVIQMLRKWNQTGSGANELVECTQHA